MEYSPCITLLGMLIISCSILVPVMNNGTYIEIMKKIDYQSLIQQKKQILVQFAADWCSICSSIKQSFQEIAQEPEFAGIIFARIDVERLDDFSQEENIVGVPTFRYVENGQKKDEVIGIKNSNLFKETLRKQLRQTFKLAYNTANANQTTDIQPPLIAPDYQDLSSTAPQSFFEKIYAWFISFLNMIHELCIQLLETINRCIRYIRHTIESQL